MSFLFVSHQHNPRHTDIVTEQEESLSPTTHTHTQAAESNTEHQWKNYHCCICRVLSKEKGNLYHLQPIYLMAYYGKLLRSYPNRHAEALVRQVLTGGPWNLALTVKGFSTRSSRTTNPLLLKVLVLLFGCCSDPLVPWGGARLCFRVQLEVKGGTCTVLSL